MPSPRVYQANAIVLRRINLGETDKIVTLLTREKGKLSAVAKGSRRPTSRLAGATELFGLCRMLLAVGQTLDVVTQVEVREAFPDLRHHLNRIAAASYMAELADHFTEERLPNEEIFDLLLAGLYVVSASDDVAYVVTAFSLHLMSVSGYSPTFDRCARCHSTGVEFPAFSPTMGGAICRACLPDVKDAMRVAAETLAAGRRMLRASVSLGDQSALTARTRSQLIRLVRAFLLFRTDRPLKSTKFLDELLGAEKLTEHTR